MHDPDLIILDEPTVGVDPQSRRYIFKIVNRLKKAGKTIIYVSHYMEEIETLCDYVAFIDRGQIIISFVKDREKGIVSRLASTPLKPYNFFLGKSIPFLVITFMQILLLSVLGIFLYDIEINNFPAYLWVVVLISLLVTSWGVAISVFAKTENTGLVMTNVIALGTAVVCGLWTPYDQLPSYLQTIGMLFPQYWAHQGLIQSVSTISGGESLIWVTLVVLSYTILGFIVSLIGYRHYIKMARN
ncbi:ABC transporter permease [Bacillus velezensis]